MAWLNDVPDLGDPAMADQPSLSDAGNFFGPPTEKTVSGPCKLYRLSGAKGRKAPQHGVWWFGAEMLQWLVDDVIESVHGGEREKNRNVLMGTRASLAVLEKWSNMGWFCEMALIPGQELRAFVGPAEQMRPQDHGMPPGPGFWQGILPGGGTQYLIYGLQTMASKNLVRVARMPTTDFIGRVSRSPGFRGVL